MQQISFAAVTTRSTLQLSPVERMAQWFQRSAAIRAGAELGQQHAMEAAPNIAPMRKPTRIGADVSAVCIYCRNKGYGSHIERDAAQLAVSRLRNGSSGASAARSATIRADHLADVYGPTKDCA